MKPAIACSKHSSTKAQSILLVEDDPLVAALTELMLSRRGFEVVVTHDAEAAWELLRHARFDLVLADVMLPGMTGIELCGRICETTAEVKLPVILVTAHAQALDLSRLADDSVDVIIKPVEPDALAAVIRQRLAEDPAAPAESMSFAE